MVTERKTTAKESKNMVMERDREKCKERRRWTMDICQIKMIKTMATDRKIYNRE
jgi:hypothetical protein